MGGISIWQIIILLVMFAIGVLPWLMALLSKKVNGSKKFVWFLLSFIFSWLGYLVYYFAVVRGLPNKESEFVPYTDNPNRQAPY